MIKIQKLDEYIEELLSQNPKQKNFEEYTRESSWTPVTHFNISRLLHIQKSSTLSDQIVLLIGQVFTVLAYHRQKNVLSIRIDTKAEVKEII